MTRNRFFKRGLWTSAVVTAAVILAVFVIGTDAQTSRKKKTSKTPVVKPTPPPVSEPVVISRADDYQDSIPVTAPSSALSRNQESVTPLSTTDQRILELSERIKELESDAKQRRLLLNLDIITRAEQRAESLRKQRFELVEKENSLQARLDQIDNDIRPDAIERTVAFAGSLRPEELRENRRKGLELERKSTQALLAEVQTTRSRLEQSVQTAEDLVEKLRTKLEKEIDDALVDNKPNQ